MTFTQNNASFDKNNVLSKVKKDISTIQSEVAELSEEISSIDNDLQDYKQTVTNEQSGQNSQINANLQSLNNLQEYTENYVEQNKELIETQVLRASEYIESPLHRIVETKEILESEIFGDEVKTKKIIINHRCSKKYIDIQNISMGTSIISFNHGALKILIGNTMYSSQGYETHECICVENNLISPIIYGYEYNDIYSHIITHGGTTIPSLYFVIKSSPFTNKLFIDYVITSDTFYTKEMFMETIVESDEALYNSTTDFTKLDNGYHTPYGYFYDKNGKIDTDVHTSSETGTIYNSSGTSMLVTFSFDYLTKGDTHTIGGKFSTLSSVPSGTSFAGSLTKLTWKAVSELLQDLDLYIPIFNYNGVVQAYLHIETPSGISGDVVSYKATILGSLGSQETFYVGQTTFLA